MPKFFCRNSRSSRVESAVMSVPSTWMLPAVGSMSLLRQRTNVDFPLPDKPMTTRISPCWTSRETSKRATALPVSFKISLRGLPSLYCLSACFAPKPKTFDRFLTEIFAILPHRAGSCARCLGKSGQARQHMGERLFFATSMRNIKKRAHTRPRRRCRRYTAPGDSPDFPKMICQNWRNTARDKARHSKICKEFCVRKRLKSCHYNFMLYVTKVIVNNFLFYMQILCTALLLKTTLNTILIQNIILFM